MFRVAVQGASYTVFEPVHLGSSVLRIRSDPIERGLRSDTELVYSDAPRRGARSKRRKDPVRVSVVIVYLLVCRCWYIRVTESVRFYYEYLFDPSELM